MILHTFGVQVKNLVAQRAPNRNSTRSFVGCCSQDAGLVFQGEDIVNEAELWLPLWALVSTLGI